ncbi:MAG TPA: TolC family protein [Gemmatimonadales bacterium]|jgi:outer membrane protein TolC
MTLAPVLALATVALALIGAPARAQDTLSVERLQEAALTSDPRGTQRRLLREATDLRLAVIGADRLPQFEVNGSASHQSDVTRPTFGIPGVAIPAFPKQHWQTTLDVEQRLYDGGDVARRRELEEARNAESQSALDVSLYELRSDVNSAFYSAFLFEKREAEYDALVGDLDARLAAVRARVEAGTALSRDAAEIDAERVRASLQRDEARASRRASLAILSDLAGKGLDTTAVLVLPTDELERSYPASLDTIATLRRRPEFDQLRRSRERLDKAIAYTAVENRPKIFAFGQAGVGLPGYDQFRSSSDAFYQVGLKLKWQPWTWRSAGRTAEAYRLQKDIVVTEEQALGRSLARAVATSLEDISRLKAALADDERIVTLRTEVERQARAQFDEGAITTPDYVETRTDVLEARLTLERHRVELAQARSTYLTTLGITPRTASETP